MCIRLYHCESFWTIIRNSPGGRPSATVGENINKHSCGRNVSLTISHRSQVLWILFYQQLVCCPDKAVPVSIIKLPTTTVATKTTSAALSNMPQKSDLNEVKNHRNIKFINVKCGSSNTVKIVGGTEADLGEFPWMALLRFKNRLDENSFTFNCGGEISFEIRENRGLIEIIFQVRSSQVFTFWLQLIA